MVLVVCLVLVLTAVFAHETWRHEGYLGRIPTRVHVNGSRGKSSVTRLIAAGLRAGGIRTIAKTTGTKPRFIYDDGSEVPVVRTGSPNIIEQVRIVRRAAQLGARALVVECMAVKPELQSLLEDRIIRATHSVITNVRADHLDEMGPNITDVAHNLGRTIATGNAFFTAEQEHLGVLRDVAAERSALVHVARASDVDEQVLTRFSYFEHAENVALALSVCMALGVDRDVALDGMVRSVPDPGAMRIYRLQDEHGEVVFINGFAVNDPDSYVLSWERLMSRMPSHRRFIGLVVCRDDRIQRSQQLGELLGDRLPVDACVVAGKETGPFLREFRRANRSGRTVRDMAGASPAEVCAAIVTEAGPTPLVVFGIGNIVGFGEQVVEEFRVRCTDPAHAGPVPGSEGLRPGEQSFV